MKKNYWTNMLHVTANECIIVKGIEQNKFGGYIIVFGAVGNLRH